ncbi:MAG: YihY/virulence factor BrkB family protein [Myxococcota bacterium]
MEEEDEEHRCAQACGRTAESPLQIPPAGWRDIIWRLRHELGRDNVTVVAAGVAFFGLLALVPALGATVSLYGLIADPADVARHLHALGGYLPASSATLFRRQLQNIVARSTTTLGLSLALNLLLSAWSASRAMTSLLSALTIAYDEDTNRSWVRLRAVSLAFTLVAVLISSVSIGLIVALPAVLVVVGVDDAVWIRWPVLFATSVGGLALLYRHGPARRPARFRWTILGALLGTTLWIGGSILLSTYIQHFVELRAYGSLGAVVAMMLWMFLTAWSVMLGAELNAEVERQTEVDTTVGPPRPRGERGAFAADTVGPCRPPEGFVKEALRRARAAARRATTSRMPR